MNKHCGRLIVGDCIEVMNAMHKREVEVDLIIGSPPYESQRSYGGLPARSGEQWVRWMVQVCDAAASICRGLVVFVVEGRTKNYDYSATPFLLVADLRRTKRCERCGHTGILRLCNNCSPKFWRPAFHLRKPPAFVRNGIPGSGGPDFWRNDYELCVAFTRAEVRKLPYGRPCAIGSPPKYQSGGVSTNRTASDKRTRGAKYAKPTIANPGNVRKFNVGGGHLGSDFAHENEAPFPLGLPAEYVQCFCPPGGIVLDPFCGSGSTPAAAVSYGRGFIGIDCRESQIELTARRLESDHPDIHRTHFVRRG